MQLHIKLYVRLISHNRQIKQSFRLTMKYERHTACSEKVIVAVDHSEE